MCQLKRCKIPCPGKPVQTSDVKRGTSTSTRVSVRFRESRATGVGRSRSLHRLRFSLIEHCPSGRQVEFRLGHIRTYGAGCKETWAPSTTSIRRICRSGTFSRHRARRTRDIQRLVTGAQILGVNPPLRERASLRCRMRGTGKQRQRAKPGERVRRNDGIKLNV
jgi:hypothetical protein